MSEYTLVPNTTLRVAISGKSGCGNTTVSTLLAEKLGITLINFTFRQLAAEKGLTLAQVIENARTDDSYDRAVDTRQVELARAESCVLGSRLAIWMLKEADVKVYLIASDDTRAKRILNREGGDLQQIKDFTAMRDREDSARYLKLYGIDNDEYEFADLKIDTATRTPAHFVSIIIYYLDKNGRVVRQLMRTACAVRIVC
ncbi:MAG: cytidylate kinase family protein [Treponemataceae bacterium]|nr:cytidylate kinase family protein [Treponemataceae bacterium]